MESKIKYFHYKNKYSLVLKKLEIMKYRAFDGPNLKAEKPQTRIQVVHLALKALAQMQLRQLPAATHHSHIMP